MRRAQMTVPVEAVHESRDGKASTGRTLAQSKLKCCTKSNRYDALEEVVDSFVSNLSATIHEGVTAFNASSAKAYGLTTDAEEVFTPHLFHEYTAPKRRSLSDINEEGKRLIVALREYFKSMRSNVVPFKSGFRHTCHPPSRYKYQNNKKTKLITSPENVLKLADCCSYRMRPTFVTAACRVASTKEHALATSNHPSNPTTAYAVRDVVSDDDDSENGSNNQEVEEEVEDDVEGVESKNDDEAKETSVATSQTPAETLLPRRWIGK